MPLNELDGRVYRSVPAHDVADVCSRAEIRRCLGQVPGPRIDANAAANDWVAGAGCQLVEFAADGLKRDIAHGACQSIFTNRRHDQAEYCW
jgi:hypothetical protein